MTDKCSHMAVKPRTGPSAGGDGVVSFGDMNVCTLVNKECLFTQTGKCQVAGMDIELIKGALKDMNVIFRERQTGKTTELIKRANDIGGIIITNTIPDAENVAKMAVDLGFKIRKPISIRQFNIMIGKILKDKVPVLVDDAEYVLQYLMNMSLAGGKIDIDTITITNENITDKACGDETNPEAPAADAADAPAENTGARKRGRQIKE